MKVMKTKMIGEMIVAIGMNRKFIGNETFYVTNLKVMCNKNIVFSSFSIFVTSVASTNLK